VTAAHLALLAAGAAVAPADETLLLLAVGNVDKAPSGIPLAGRVALLQAVAERRADVSIVLASHGRFVDKARALRPHYPSGTSLTFVVGFDTLVRLFDPKYYADPPAALGELFAGSAFVAANRAPDPPEALAAFLARPEVRPYARRILPVTLPDAIASGSATEVRARIARGEPVADLVPPETLGVLPGVCASLIRDAGSPSGARSGPS
jgi:nicotinamide-nucleotide adenylyltransferase